MPQQSDTDNGNAPQLASAEPGAEELTGVAAEVAPVSPGLGPVVAQGAAGPVIPDLTLLDLEQLLSLDPTAHTTPFGRSHEPQALQPSLGDADLPADLTALDLAQLIELNLSGSELPTILEVAGLAAKAADDADEAPADDDHPKADAAETFASKADNNAPPEQAAAGDRADPGSSAKPGQAPVAPVLDGDSDDVEVDTAFESDEASSFSSGTVHASAGNGAAVPNGQGNNGPAPANNGHGNGSASNNGLGQGGNADASANAGAAITGHGTTRNNAAGGSGARSGGNPHSGASGLGVGLAVAAINFPGGGDLPLPIAPAEVVAAGDSGQDAATATPAALNANAPGTTPPGGLASTFVASSDTHVSPASPPDAPTGSSYQAPAAPAPTGATLPATDVAAASEGSAKAPAAPGAGVAMGGGGGTDTIVGTNGADDLRGKGGDDTIDGLGGDDTLDGGGGDDVLRGGDGSDELAGRGGDDTLLGGLGDDTLSGGGGSDFLDGGAGQDELFGGGGADVIVWDFNDLHIDGGGNTDTLRVAGGDVDIAAFAGTVEGIDQIDLAADAGANALTLSYQDVLDLTDNADTLAVFGNPGDSLDAGTGWTDGGIDGNGNHVYVQGNGGNTATLVVDPDVTVNANILV